MRTRTSVLSKLKINMKTQTLRQFHWNLAKFDLRYFISTRFLGYPFELKTWIDNYFAPASAPDQKLVIFSTGRSGSTLLVELLNCYPSVHCDAELLKRKLVDPFKLIEARAGITNADIYGFKLLSYQLRDIQTSIQDKKAFLNELHNKGYKTIYLYRENKLLQSISVIRAMTQCKWHSNKVQSSSNKKITLDIEVLKKTLKGLESLAIFEQKMLEDIPHLSLCYEYDLKDQFSRELTMQKLGDFLNQDYVTPKNKLKKLNRGHLSDYIHNWDEVLQFLKSSKYAHYLDSALIH